MSNIYAISLINFRLNEQQNAQLIPLNKEVSVGSSFDKSIIVERDNIPSDFLTIIQENEQLKVQLNFNIQDVVVFTESGKETIKFGEENIFEISKVKFIKFCEMKLKIIKPIVYNSNIATEEKVSHNDIKSFIISILAFVSVFIFVFDGYEKTIVAAVISVLCPIGIFLISCIIYIENKNLFINSKGLIKVSSYVLYSLVPTMCLSNYMFYSYLKYSDDIFIVFLTSYLISFTLTLLLSFLFFKLKEIKWPSFLFCIILSPLTIILLSTFHSDYFEDRVIKAPSFLNLNDIEIDFEEKFIKLEIKNKKKEQLN
jgi:hypothetical protein